MQREYRIEKRDLDYMVPEERTGFKWQCARGENRVWTARGQRIETRVWMKM